MGSVLQAEVAPPQLFPSTADSAVGLDVEVICNTPSTEIHYTLNGAEPTRFDPVVVHGGKIRVSRNATVKVKAWFGNESSETATEDYRITGAVALGDQYGLAVSRSGAVWSWGNQNYGKLGNGLSSDNQVVNPTRVLHGSGNFETGEALAAGFTHSLVRDQQGAVWSFGRNDVGQLGNGTTTNSSTPLQVKLTTSPVTYLADSLAIAAGQDWSMALRADGSLISWGSQATGRIGNGTGGDRMLPGPVQRGDDGGYPALTGIRGIAAGAAFGLAREPHAFEGGGNGEVWSWGYNNTGQLGLGHTNNITRAMPVKLDTSTLLTDVLDLSAGEAHAVFLRWHATDPSLQGSVWACGNRAYGRIGNGSTTAGSVTFPTPVLKAAATPLDQIEQISAGAAHTLALDKDGHVWAWGYNGHGQLGDNSTTNRDYAVKVKNPAGTGDLSNIVRIAAGGDNLQGASMAIAADGTIYAWGRNNQGQLGTGGTSVGSNKLPVAQAQNRVEDGAPALTLSHTVTDSVEKGALSVTATPSYSGTGGISNIDRVEIFLNGERSATFSGNTWSGTIGNLKAGSYHGYGMVFDDNGLTAMSAPFTFEITLDPNGDNDGDGLSNSVEATLGTDPFNPDTDGDGMEDGYEQWNTFSPLVVELGTKGPSGDFDGDGMNNLTEHNVGLTASVFNNSAIIDPSNLGPNGMLVRWFGRTGFWYTLEYSTNLIQWTTFPVGFIGENHELSVDVGAWYGAPLPSKLFVRTNWGPADTEDMDGDGLPADFEMELGLDPTRADSDQDGVPDGLEDADGDGVGNAREFRGKTPAADPAQFPVHMVTLTRSATGNYNPESSYLRWNQEWGTNPPWSEVFNQSVSPAALQQGARNIVFPALPPLQEEGVESIDLDFASVFAMGRFSQNADTTYGQGNLTHRRIWLRAPSSVSERKISLMKRVLDEVGFNYPRTSSSESADVVEFTIPANSQYSTPVDIEPLPSTIAGTLSTVTITVNNVSIQPAEGMAGVVGDTLASADPTSKDLHFVSPKKTTEIPAEYVILDAVGLSGDQLTPNHADQVAEWVGGQEVPNQPLKRRVKRDEAARTVVKIKTLGQGGKEVAKLDVWVVWTEIEHNPFEDMAFSVSDKDSYYTGSFDKAKHWRFRFKIKPEAIITNIAKERPDLAGAKETPVPGELKDHFWEKDRFADNATKKWDLSRQAEITIYNVDSAIPKNKFPAEGEFKYKNQPKDKDVPVSYPTNAVEGNDDPGGPLWLDEDGNPYAKFTGQGNSAGLDHEIGVISSRDGPSIVYPNTMGVSGATLSEIINFKEFARLEICSKTRSKKDPCWYRISDYMDWHHVMGATFGHSPQHGGDRWGNTGSTSGTGTFSPDSQQ